MAELIISCLSQKGGVGKSTLARLIATAYAEHNQKVAIYDFNGAQETSGFWVGLRRSNNIEPDIHAEMATQANRMRHDRRFDVIVADGRPDSPDITLSIAHSSDLIIVPTSFTVDDLVPQRRFAFELTKQGVDQHKIMFVVNRVLDHADLTKDAQEYLKDFKVAETALPYRVSFVRAHMGGYSVGEVDRAVMGNTDRLKTVAGDLATEIATYVTEMEDD